MKRILLPVIGAGLLAMSVNAGTSTITGHATVSVEPEYGQFTVQLESKCFPSIRALNESHDKTAAAMQRGLNDLVGEINPMNGVTTLPGFSGRSDGITVYDAEGRASKVCVGTYSKSTSFTVKSDKKESFTTFWDEANILVTDLVSSLATEGNTPSTYANITSFQGQICEETRLAKNLKALTQARLNAEANFKALFEGVDAMCFDNVKISATKEPGMARMDGGYYGRKMFESAPGDSAPLAIVFENIQVSVSQDFEFTYPDVCTMTK